MIIRDCRNAKVIFNKRINTYTEQYVFIEIVAEKLGCLFNNDDKMELTK